MAEAEVTLTYRERPALVLRWVLILILPLFSLFALLSTFSALSVYLDSAFANNNAAIFITGILMLSGLIVLGLVTTSDRTIFLTRDGISVPVLLSPSVGLRTHFSWSRLTAIKFRPSGRRGLMELQFKAGAPLRLKLDLLPPEDIQNLIVSLDVWAGGMDSFPALLEARTRLLPSSQIQNETGYTELWEEELTRRFGPTNFVPLEPAQTVGSFTIDRQLAFGGFSAIYLVADGKGHRYVLKEAVIPSDAVEEKRTAAESMFAREAAILASLNHPNLVKVRDSFVEAGRHYILMDYIQGEDFRRLVKEHGRQNEADVIAWAEQLLDILSYLHNQTPAVVHRDVSPDNLMLSESGDLFVIDFGAANHFAGKATGTLIGKQAYIAPEQLRGHAEPRSDLYAFGCAIHFMLTGKDPEPLEVSHPREVATEVSVALDQLVASCTAQEPEYRPASAAELLKQLRQLKGAT